MSGSWVAGWVWFRGGQVELVTPRKALTTGRGIKTDRGDWGLVLR